MKAVLYRFTVFCSIFFVCIFVFLWLWCILSPKPDLLDDLSFSAIITDRHGELLRITLSRDGKYRARVHLQDVAPAAIRAILRYEDRYFFMHPGVNLFALARAVWQTLACSRRMGGSTLTMQVVRLRQKRITSNPTGKFAQILAALQLEYHYSKNEILEAYCNIAPYGGNVEGLEAAARIWFHKPAKRLTYAESLALALIPQNPVRRHPVSGTDFDKARTRLHNHWHDTSQHLPPLRLFSLKDLPFAAPHAVTEITQSAKHGGIIQTTLDLSMQYTVEKLIRNFTDHGRQYGLNNAAALLVYWPDMEIRALAGSANFYDASIHGQVDGTRAKRSPGSTLKPFIYALALEQGLIHPISLLADTPHTFHGYDPENFDHHFRGPISAKEALQASRNIPAIALAAQLRIPGLYGFLQRAKINLPFSEEHYGLSLVLGGAEISMRDLAILYAMLANQGILHDLKLARTTDESEGIPLLAPEAAFMVLDMLAKEDEKIPCRRESLPLYIKTGTSNGFRDAWTAGIFGSYVLIVWAGNFDNRSNPLLTGGTVAAPLFRDIARAISEKDCTIHDLISQQSAKLNLKRIAVCSATGDIDTRLCPEKAFTWFWSGVSPVRSSGVFRKILVNRKTGLRACAALPGQTQEVIWEFWSTDMQKLFLRAGIVKSPPPPYDPDDPLCIDQKKASLSASVHGNPPKILVPKEGIIYQIHISAPQKSPVPLTAASDADTDQIFWFSGKKYLGSTTPGQSLLWIPAPGIHELRAIDTFGRMSSRRLQVESVP